MHKVAAANVRRSRLGCVRIFASFIVSKVATEKASLCSILPATWQGRGGGQCVRVPRMSESPGQGSLAPTTGSVLALLGAGQVRGLCFL